LTYEAASPDNGNIKFEFVATDTDGANSANNPSAYFLVNPNADFSIDVQKIHKPVILSAGAAFTPTSRRLVLGTTETLTVTVNVEDDDLALAWGDSHTATATLAKASFVSTDGSQQEVACGTATAVAGTAVVQGATSYTPFTITWSPATSLPGGFDPAVYGETFCTFTIEATDSYSQTSQQMTFVASVAGSAVVASSSGQLPQFNLVMAESTVTQGTTTTLTFKYTDADDNVAYGVEGTSLGVSDSNTAEDCTASCTKSVSIAIAADAPTGAQDVIITLTDASGLTATHTVTYTVEASARRRRAAATEVATLSTTIRVEDGVFYAELPQSLVADMGPAPTDAPIDEEAPEDNGNGNGNGMSASNIATIGGSIAGCVVVVLGVVAAVVASRRRANTPKILPYGGKSTETWELELPAAAFNPRLQLP
jgi:hypothetical protein